MTSPTSRVLIIGAFNAIKSPFAKAGNILSDRTTLIGINIPENAILATTIETNRDGLYKDLRISKAPVPSERYHMLRDLPFKGRKILVMEPIMDFDLDEIIKWITRVQPWRVYVGYNSHPKECPLPEPSLDKTLELVRRLRADDWDVRTKLLREPVEATP